MSGSDPESLSQLNASLPSKGSNSEIAGLIRGMHSPTKCKVTRDEEILEHADSILGKLLNLLMVQDKQSQVLKTSLCAKAYGLDEDDGLNLLFNYLSNHKDIIHFVNLTFKETSTIPMKFGKQTELFILINEYHEKKNEKNNWKELQNLNSLIKAIRVSDPQTWDFYNFILLKRSRLLMKLCYPDLGMRDLSLIKKNTDNFKFIVVELYVLKISGIRNLNQPIEPLKIIQDFVNDCPMEGSELQAAIEFLAEKIDDKTFKGAKLRKVSENVKLPSVHSDFPTLSSKLSPCFTPNRGRHIRTSEKILPGDILLVEDPSLCYDQSAEKDSRCYWCCRLNYGPIPTNICSNHCFCSEECKEEGSYVHDLDCQYECIHSIVGLTDRKEGRGQTVAKAVFKYVAFKKLNFFIENYDDAFRVQDLNSQWPSYDPEVNVFKHLASLVEHRHHRKVYETIHVAILSILFLEILRRNDYFPDYIVNEFGHDVLSANHLLICRVLFRLLHSTPINAYGVGNNLDEKYPNFIGVYPMASFFNHSCAPNATFVYQGTKAICCANDIIDIGEEVRVSYGNIRYDKAKSPVQRIVHLQLHFNFTCDCMACKGVWDFETIKSNGSLDGKLPPAIKCSNCRKIIMVNGTQTSPMKVSQKRRARCPNCGENLRLDKVKRKMEIVIDKLKNTSLKYEKSPNRALESLIKTSEVLHNFLPLPNPWAHQTKAIIEEIFFKLYDTPF